MKNTKNKKYHWTPPSNEELANFGGYDQQQKLVDVLATQILPFFSHVEQVGEILQPLHIYVALLVGKQLLSNVYWNIFCLTTPEREFAVIFNWLFHPQMGFHVENMVYSAFENNPALYKRGFTGSMYAAYPYDNVNKDVTKYGFPSVKVLYNKPVLARLFRLHLNLFNPELVKQARKLGILNPLLRSLVQLSRSEGTYKYVLLCMEEMSFYVNETGNYSLQFNGMPFSENERL